MPSIFKITIGSASFPGVGDFTFLDGDCWSILSRGYIPELQSLQSGCLSLVTCAQVPCVVVKNSPDNEFSGFLSVENIAVKA